MNGQIRGATDARPINRQSLIPAWGQIVQDLRHQIETGALPPGTQLPSEVELAHRYGVSRKTLRQALAELARHHLVERIHGSGTFVANSRVLVQHDLSLGGPWRDRLDGVGLELNCEVTTNALVSPPAGILNRLDGEVRTEEFGDLAVHVERVQRIAATPIGISSSWVPSDRAPGLEARFPLIDHSLSAFLRQEYNLRSDLTENRLFVSMASGLEAGILQTSLDDPLFEVLALVRDEGGQLIQVSRTVWLARRVRFRSVRRGTASELS